MKFFVSIYRIVIKKNQTQILTESSPFNYNGLYRAEEAGLYKITAGDYTRYIMLGEPNPKEYQEMRSTEAILSPFVQKLHGKIERVDNAASMQIVQSSKKNQFASARRFFVKQGECNLFYLLCKKEQLSSID